MANDGIVYENAPRLRLSDYAELRGSSSSLIVVRGSKYADWPANYFDAEAARRLAHYILELADDAENWPVVKELAQDLRDTCFSFGPEAQAKALVAKGYHK